MTKYVDPPRFDPDDLKRMIDPDGGFLCMTMHWRPDPDAPDPEMPGQKLSMSSYIPVRPREACLCGSSKRYRDCCQLERLWHPVCPNPGGPERGFGLTRPQSARFRGVDGVAIRERLMADARLCCVDTSRASSFWILFGVPPVEEEYGILCFGDIELKHNRALVVSAMSDLRMAALLALLREIAGDLLEEPRIVYGEVPMIDKETSKTRMQRPSRLQTPRRRRRRRRRR
jgi:hypothetical protein